MTDQPDNVYPPDKLTAVHGEFPDDLSCNECHRRLTLEHQSLYVDYKSDR